MPWSDGLDQASPAFAIAASANNRIRVLAGPGAGKSFAMKRRVARLLEADGVAPDSVLAVTFTRVAAEDLHRELVSLQIEGADVLEGRTLHSLAMKILMRNHVMQALGRTPRPLNVFEVQPLLQDLSGAHGNKTQRKRMLEAYVAAWAQVQSQQPQPAQTPAQQAFAADLLNWLRFHQAMHIGEVIPQLYEYLRLNPGCAERGEFSHILIDEYQDLNRVEQEVLNLLGNQGAVCIIGDDDQSIYSFKYAHPAGVRDWADINGAESHAIADCRRCPTTVVRMANALISRNQDRQPRQMSELPQNGPGDVQIRQYDTAELEADAVAQKISQLVQAGVAPGDIIVLAQRRTFGTPVFERLRDLGVPTKSYYAEAALSTRDAQERFAMLKLYLNREDRVALRWLLGCTHNQWYSNPYARVMAHCHETGMSPWQTLEAISSGDLTIRFTTPLVTRFGEIVAELDVLQQSADVEGFVNTWLPTPANYDLLADAVFQCQEGCGTVEELYEELYAAITEPDVPLEVTEVRVMSFHKSKGLSSPYVFIVGCVEGLHPSHPDEDFTPAEAAAKLEEDRRLFYVGITRVKADPHNGKPGYLAITYPRTMETRHAMRSQIRPVSRSFGTAHLQASRFLGEMAPAAPQPLVGPL